MTAGIAALRRRDFNVDALLVAAGAPRLGRAGLDLPAPAGEPDAPELALYAALGAERAGATPIPVTTP